MAVVVVTGSGGTVGSHAADYYAKAGFDVVGIDNNLPRRAGHASTEDTISGLLRLHPRRYQHIHDDVCSAEVEKMLRRLAGDIVLIIHAASLAASDRAPACDNFSVHLITTLHLLERVRELCPDAVFVHPSTYEVYGDATDRLPLVDGESRVDLASDHPLWHGIPEDFPIDQVGRSLYAVSKISADLTVQEFGWSFGLKTVCFRCGPLVATRGSERVLRSFLGQLMQCGVEQRPASFPVPQAKQVRDILHCGDFIAAVDAFARNPRSAAVYTLGGGRANNCSLMEAVRMCEEASGRRIAVELDERPVVRTPRWWISSSASFHADYPEYRVSFGLPRILTEMAQELGTAAHSRRRVIASVPEATRTVHFAGAAGDAVTATAEANGKSPAEQPPVVSPRQRHPLRIELLDTEPGADILEWAASLQSVGVADTTARAGSAPEQIRYLIAGATPAPAILALLAATPQSVLDISRSTPSVELLANLSTETLVVVSPLQVDAVRHAGVQRFVCAPGIPAALSCSDVEGGRFRVLLLTSSSSRVPLAAELGAYAVREIAFAAHPRAERVGSLSGLLDRARDCDVIVVEDRDSLRGPDVAGNAALHALLTCGRPVLLAWDDASDSEGLSCGSIDELCGTLAVLSRSGERSAAVGACIRKAALETLAPERTLIEEVVRATHDSAGVSPVSSMGNEIRILIFYDLEGWAWWHRAHRIREHIGPGFHVDVAKFGTSFDHRHYDFILLFDAYPLTRYHWPVPAEKVVVGCSNPKLLPRTIEAVERFGCAGGIINNAGTFAEVQERPNFFLCENGVDMDLFYPRLAAPETPVGCWVGHNGGHGKKGLEIILEVTKALGIPVRYFDRVGQDVRGVLPQETVRDELYHRSTFYICMSESEGTPNTALEALACGIPVVTTAVGNMPELITDGWNGFLCERTTDSLAAAIRRLVAANHAELRKNARRSVEDGWSWKEQVQKYATAFVALFEQRKGRHVPANGSPAAGQF